MTSHTAFTSAPAWMRVLGQEQNASCNAVGCVPGPRLRLTFGAREMSSRIIANARFPRVSTRNRTAICIIVRSAAVALDVVHALRIFF